LIVPHEDCPDESRDPLTMAGMILQTDLTRAQLLGEALQNARGKKKFVLGEPLIWPELLPFLPTRMAELHKWYAVQSKANQLEMFPARIKDEHFWRGEMMYISSLQHFTIYTIKMPFTSASSVYGACKYCLSFHYFSLVC